MPDLIIPDIQNSIFAHTVHVLLIGGVGVYAWQTVKALVRRPRSVGTAITKAVRGAWLAVLFLLLTQPNPLPYLSAAGAVALALIALSMLNRLSKPAKREELLTSGPAGALSRETEFSRATASTRRP